MGFALGGRTNREDQTRTSPDRTPFHPRTLRTTVFRGSLFVFGLLLCSFSPAATNAQTFGCTPPLANDIVCENSKPGNPSTQWDITGAGDDTIQGFATDISVNQ